MKANKFSDIPQNIEKDLLNRAGRRRRESRKKAVIRIAALCACLALVITGSAHFLFGNTEPEDIPSILPSASALGVAQYPEQTAYPIADQNTDPDLFNQQFKEWSLSKNKIKELYTDTSGNSEYVKKLMAALMQDDGENKVLSPANMYFALAMLAEITDGNSREQVLDLLGKNDISSLRENTGRLWEKMYSNDGQTTSVLANSLWLSNEHEYDKDTVNVLKNSYFASTYSGDFKKEEYTQAVRDWINEQTSGQLKQSADGIELDAQTVLALVSAIYYKAGWQNTFNETETNTRIFHSPAGDVEARFMYNTLRSFYYGDGFKAVGLELGYDSEMVFILPDEGCTVSDVLKNDAALQFIAGDSNALSSADSTVYLSVPKFDISCDTDLLKAFKELGITDLLSCDSADFSPITKQDVYLDTAKHSARVKIDENGVEAAAFTLISAAKMSDTLEQTELVFDRPFIFVIRGADGLPLFTGIVNQP